MILPLETPASALSAPTSSSTLLNIRTDAVTRGAVVLLPALDSQWLDGRGRPLVLVVGFAVVALVALLVAAAAHLRSQHHRTRGAGDDDELFTATPLPMSNEEMARHHRDSGHHAFSGLRLPRWLQAGSLLAALAITWVVAQRIQPANGSTRNSDSPPTPSRVGVADRVPADSSDSPEDLDLTPDSTPAFAFRVRGWVTRGSGCAGMLEVTKGEPRAWDLTARVHDGQGQLIDTTISRVVSLREGDVVEFKFPKAPCDQIGAWDVRGGRPR